MYLFYLTMKTPNGIMALSVLLYTIILAIVLPKISKKEKYNVVRLLCILPAAASLVHYITYGNIALEKFQYLYIESALPLLFLLPGKSRKVKTLKCVLSALSVFSVCIYFLIDAIDSPIVHNYTKMNYTDSFRKMLGTLEKEYCLSSWKRIDYDSLAAEYLPKVKEAESNKDEIMYAEIITEVISKFYDVHTNVDLSPETDDTVSDFFAGNDYGFSLVRLDDGSVISVLLDDDEIWFSDEKADLDKLGIHNGTQILTWDGKDINSALDNLDCIYPGEEFPVKSNEDVYRPIYLAGKGGESVCITFIDDNGNEQTAVIKRIGNYYNRMWAAIWALNNGKDNEKLYLHNYTCMLDDKCGYLKVRQERFDKVKDYIAAIKNGYYPELIEYYAGLIDDLRTQGMESLVIDIRNNVGGDDSCAGALASLFTDEKRHMVAFGFEDDKGYHIRNNLYIFPDGRYKDIPVVVLVNDNCVSAGDGLAKFLSDCDNVTLMGITSSGGVNQNNGGFIYLTDNILVKYPVFLSLSEGSVPLIDTDHTRENRIPLDVTIPMTKDLALKMFSYHNLEDPELDYAVEYLKNQ